MTCKQKDSPYCIAQALLNAQKGRLSHGFAFAGDNAWRAESILSVKKPVGNILREYRAACLNPA